MKKCHLMFVLAAVICLAGISHGSSAPLGNYQGLIRDASLNPVNGVHNLTVRIFADSTGGLPVWQETHNAVTITDGIFRIELGSVTPLSLETFTDPQSAPGLDHRFLEIEVQGDSPISPRTRLVSSPYSVAAARVSGDVITDEGKLIVPDPIDLDDRITLDATTPLMTIKGLPAGGHIFRLDAGAKDLKIKDSAATLSSEVALSTNDSEGHIQLQTGGSSSESLPMEQISFSVTPEIPGDPGGSTIQMSGHAPSSGADYPTESVSLSVVPESPLGQGRSSIQLSTTGGHGQDILSESVSLSVSPESPFGRGISEIQLSGRTGSHASDVVPTDQISMSVALATSTLDGQNSVRIATFENTGGGSSSLPLEQISMSVVQPELGRGGSFIQMTSYQSGGGSGNVIPTDQISMSVAPGGSDSAAGASIQLTGYQSGSSDPQPVPMEQLSLSVAPDTGFSGKHPGIELVQFSPGGSGDVVPVEQFSLNYRAADPSPDGLRKAEFDSRSFSYFDSTSAGSEYVQLSTNGGAGPKFLLGSGTSGSSSEQLPTESISMSLNPSEPLVKIRPPGTIDGEVDGLRYEYDALSRQIRSTVTDIDNTSRSCMIGPDGVLVADGPVEFELGNAGISIKDVLLGVTYFEATPLGTMSTMGGCTLAKDPGHSVVVGDDGATEKLTVIGNICATGTIGPCSDSRYKKNVETIGNAAGLLRNLRGVYFDWNREKYAKKEFSSDRQIGLIAQEVREVLPSVVSKGADGYYSVDYARIVPLLIEDAKQKDLTIEQLKAEMSELSSKLVKMERLLMNSLEGSDKESLSEIAKN